MISSLCSPYVAVRLLVYYSTGNYKFGSKNNVACCRMSGLLCAVLLETRRRCSFCCRSHQLKQIGPTSKPNSWPG